MFPSHEGGRKVIKMAEAKTLNNMFLLMFGSDEWLQVGRMKAIREYITLHNIPAVQETYNSCLQCLQEIDSRTAEKFIAVMEG